MLTDQDIDIAKELLFHYSDERWCWFGAPDLTVFQLQAAHDEYVLLKDLFFLKTYCHDRYLVLLEKCRRLNLIAGEFSVSKGKY